jgi:hypothetical protein
VPFDLNKPYRTRDGREAWAVRSPKPLGYDGEYELVGWIEEIEGERPVEAWTKEGRYDSEGSDINDDLDLVNVPERHVGWVNIYAGVVHSHVDGRIPFHTGVIFESEGEARRFSNISGTTPVATVQISFEESAT